MAVLLDAAKSPFTGRYSVDIRNDQYRITLDFQRCTIIAVLHSATAATLDVNALRIEELRKKGKRASLNSVHLLDRWIESQKFC